MPGLKINKKIIMTIKERDNIKLPSDNSMHLKLALIRSEVSKLSLSVFIWLQNKHLLRPRWSIWVNLVTMVTSTHGNKFSLLLGSHEGSSVCGRQLLLRSTQQTAVHVVLDQLKSSTLMQAIKKKKKLNKNCSSWIFDTYWTISWAMRWQSALS